MGRGGRRSRASRPLCSCSARSLGHLYCSWPLVEGRGEIPALMLGEFRARLGGAGALDGALDIFSGEFRELSTATSSYVILAGSDLPQTSIPAARPSFSNEGTPLE